MTSEPNEPRANILIVDDNAANLLAAEALLAQLGQRVVLAHSGEEALRCVLRDDFAVVLMDIHMPELDGYQTTALLREHPRTRNLPVIFLTAFRHSDEFISKAYRHGAVDYLSKPCDPDILRAKVTVFVQLYLQREQARRNAETALREQAAREAAEATSRAKDEFLAMVSHELRTPLNAILGWSQVLKSAALPDERLQRAVTAIQRSAKVQSTLIEELLDVSRMVTGKFQVEPRPSDLRATIQAAVEQMRPIAAEKRIEIAERYPARHEEVPIDPERMQLVVSNLLGNAIKFSPAGAAIEVTLERSGSQYELRVRDHGPGIPADFLPHVFDRFRQGEAGAARHHGGLGLGLAIVRHIAVAHGGTVDARSDGEGRGATLIVRLPTRLSEIAVVPASDGVPVAAAIERTRPMTRRARAELVDPEHALDEHTLLVVEPHPDTAEMLTVVLRDAGAEVIAVPTVERAIAELGARRVDAVLCDLFLPSDAGFELARALPADLPAIALSAGAAPDVGPRAIAAGFCAHLEKPFEVERLLSLLRRALAKPAAAKSSA